jgi:hypothetical protein
MTTIANLYKLIKRDLKRGVDNDTLDIKTISMLVMAFCFFILLAGQLAYFVGRYYGKCP